jgi:hypothetical protein
MHRSLTLVVNVVLTSFVPVASAHHGFFAHFDPDKVLRIEGTVKRFDFINPHGYLYIDSVNDAGEPVDYVCELQARNQLIRKGADKNLCTVGESILVVGYAAQSATTFQRLNYERLLFPKADVQTAGKPLF